MKDRIRAAEILMPCADLTRTLEFYTETLGFRLEMIFPADAPQTAVVSGYGLTLRIEESDEIHPLTINLLGDFDEHASEIISPDGAKIRLINESTTLEIPEAVQEFVVSKLDAEDAFNVGRAGMAYRDLIPSRLNGHFIASHIRIEKGGAVADYVHYHKIRFQMIYCVAGFARLVYEDFGEPFVMKKGDCVLQPPEIRHRVLECSDAFEVVEIGSPAVHETFAEHAFDLPNDSINHERIFGKQRFVHHVADDAFWGKSSLEGFVERDTGIAAATDGLADARVLRAATNASYNVSHTGEFLFFFVLDGNVRLANGDGENYSLEKYDSFVLPAGKDFIIEASQDAEMLRVRL